MNKSPSAKLKILGVLIVCALGASVAIVAWAGIAESVHNLGTTGNSLSANGGARNEFTGTSEICVFCHTPHGGDASAAVPLWNRNLNNPANYSTYDQLGTSTLDAQVAEVGSVSIGCLSCHDGTMALDAMINEPGSGADNPGFSAGTWTGDDTVGPADGRLAPGIVQNLGTDLTNDHPIGMQYAGGGVSASTPVLPQGETVDPDFAPVLFEVRNGRYQWWVDKDWRTGGDGDRSKTDVQLYTRTSSNGYAGQSQQEPFVECASCHDPHTTENPTFLRISNTDTPSGLCLTCHVK
ncbi:MAG: cytochrome c3 family protein [Gammaproteobacteria bacterium]|nr:cytochrome c3 family protein [Gammaproteobacteria bacterium]MDH5730330.1 cytochrome c3 family protein [Gammaproteobacteria bacterium]